MQDLTGAAQRHYTRTLAFLMASVLILPAGVSAQEASPPPSEAPTEQTVAPTDAGVPTEPTAGEPTPSEAAAPSASPTATAAPEPTATDTEAAAPALPPSTDPTVQASPSESASDDGVVGAVVPVPPSEPSAPSSAPGQVQAEGSAAEEVVVSPVVPEQAPGGEDVAVAGEDAAAEQLPVVDSPADEDDAAPAPPAITAYGPQVVPSLGTAFAPNTNTYTGTVGGSAPEVLAPEVAGADPGAPQAPPGETLTGTASVAGTAGLMPAGSPAATGLEAVMDPVRTAASSSLSIVQPSWFATTLALLILLVAASYGALLRRRGEFVPEAVDFSRAIRPGDAARLAVSSVRPTDLVTGQARSIRP